ncbi:GNAT family N-acetyltransferase [Staphylococcus agnetis]|uniref:GNAT family N-acetyltransferase n=1 Tax=Staphylococcus agnetis TaxID=985762 RepID=UPI00208E234A|nr:GNAT family protein [Staphylococcus agnetis]MCO4345600.1 GNAT family N-acetyltransferase [Staphylococcus agnetis]MCO4354711.1 GNAT family N-acetyltransferase [Staphylococcus agnetis]MCO4359476.1 GNAT family N-acetyltransferase [Staphylococcus agnetis]MCO4364769.1 GNAT family N-acetyltransferase [Staphylococcus agnetis]MCO4371231.1 GNAT family N-acetyltransferase [Staphylococcus agnetis]
MIRHATFDDIDTIVNLTEDAKILMDQDGNPQWDHRYTLKTHFETDIQSDNMYVLEEDGIIKGFIVIDQKVPDWYNDIDWPISISNAYVIHRLVASAQYKGVAQQLFDFAFDIAHSHQVGVILTDTFSLNARAQRLFEKNGFIKTGEMTSNEFPFDKGEPFYAYYKNLNE